LISDFLDHINKLACFSRRDPREVKSAFFDAHVLNKVLEQGEFSSSIVITFQVMAVTWVSSRNPDSISTLPESCQEKLGIHPTGTWDPNGSDVRGILQPAHPGKICCPVGAPIAEEGNYLGLPAISLDLFHLSIPGLL
jgi:hypothetical protein